MEANETLKEGEERLAQSVAEEDEIQRVAKEDDHNDGDNKHETENQDETSSLLPHRDPVFTGTPTSYQLMNPIGTQQQLNRNPAPSSHQLPEDPFGQQSPYPLPIANFHNPNPPPMAYHHNPYYPAPMAYHHDPTPMAYHHNPAPMAYHHDPAPRAYHHDPPPRAYHHDPPPRAYHHDPPPRAYHHDPSPRAYHHDPPPRAYHHDPPPRAYHHNPPPMVNMMMPQFRSDQMLRMIPPREQPRPLAGVENYYNPQQQFVLPDPNHQPLQQIQPQIQQPTQSQGFDAGASSDQGQDQQQPR